MMARRALQLLTIAFLAAAAPAVAADVSVSAVGITTVNTVSPSPN